MTESLKETLDSIMLDCKCPFRGGARSRCCELKELLFLAGYCFSDELAYIDRGIKTKIENNNLTDAQRALLVQVHEEIKSFYGMVAQEVNQHHDKKEVKPEQPIATLEPQTAPGP